MNSKEYKDSLFNLDLKSILEVFTINDMQKLKKAYPDHYFLLAEQIKLYPRAQEKLPELAGKYCYFTTKSYEQSSSEKLAGFKASLFGGDALLDLTGGLGVDDIAFSKSFKKVISVDNDTKLNNIARINFAKLNLGNIKRDDADTYEYIKQDLKADLIYIDADRRLNSRKSIRLEYSEPNVIKILNRLWEISGDILLKLSPLADITYIIKSLPHIKKIIVISLENEVKEILVHLNASFTGEIAVKAVDISEHGKNEYSFDFNNNTKPDISSEGKYFYEPANCLIKAGMINSYASVNNMKVISKNGIYLVSETLIHNFLGRKFIIISILEFSKSEVLNYLKEKNISSANISCRNFPLRPEEIKKVFKIKDGGEDYLFFTMESNKNKLLYHCRKI